LDRRPLRADEDHPLTDGAGDAPAGRVGYWRLYWRLYALLIILFLGFLASAIPGCATVAGLGTDITNAAEGVRREMTEKP